MRRALLLSLVLVLAGACTPGGTPQAPPEDPIGRELFPPELILGHQGELGLDDAQRDAMIAEVQKAQAQMVPLQWKLSADSEEMARLLHQDPVDEARTLAKAEDMMQAEQQVKRTQLTLLIRLKNLLRPPQQEKLRALEAK